MNWNDNVNTQDGHKVKLADFIKLVSESISPIVSGISIKSQLINVDVPEDADPEPVTIPYEYLADNGLIIGIATVFDGEGVVMGTGYQYALLEGGSGSMQLERGYTDACIEGFEFGPEGLILDFYNVHNTYTCKIGLLYFSLNGGD